MSRRETALHGMAGTSIADRAWMCCSRISSVAAHGKPSLSNATMRAGIYLPIPMYRQWAYGRKRSIVKKGRAARGRPGCSFLSLKSSLLRSLFLLLALLLPDCKPGLEPLTQLLDRVNEGFIRSQLINLLLQILHLFL